MKFKRRSPLPRTIRDMEVEPLSATTTMAPRASTVVSRTVTICADFDRITADLEQELRVALDGEIVALVAGRIRR
jgi:hypothetical protein